MDWKKDCWSKENYQDFKNHLLQIAEEEYRKFNEKIVPCDHPILGIRMPVLRKLAKEIARGVEGKVKTTVFEEEQKEEMTEYLEKLLREGDAVLFKGSNSMKLGETAARFI